MSPSVSGCDTHAAACQPGKRYPFADSTSIRISIPDFTSHKTDSRLYSHTQTCGGYLWRLLVFPNGNRVADVLSVYLDFVGRDDSRTNASIASASSASSSTLSIAQASDAPLLPPPPPPPSFDLHTASVAAARVQTETDTQPPPPPHAPGAGAGDDDDVAAAMAAAAAEDAAAAAAAAAASAYAPVVEARVWFSVVPPPQQPQSEVRDDSSGVISTVRDDAGERSLDAAGNSRACGSGGGDQDEKMQEEDPVELKDCKHRFTSPDNDWGFRELIHCDRAHRYLDDNGSLTLDAQIVVFCETYTAVRDKIMANCSVQRVSWLDVIPLVQQHEGLAATAPTRVGYTSHNDGASLLHAACKAGSRAYASLLVARGASLDVEDKCGRTPLFYAARAGALEVVEWLVDEHGACVNVRDSENRSALFGACEEGKIDVVEYLVSKGADYKTADYEGDTAVRVAEGRGHLDVASLLKSLS